LAGQVGTSQPIVRGRLSALGEGLQILVYCRDQPDLFARICAYFHAQNLDVLDAKIHTTQHGYALDSFMLADPEQVATYRERISLIETGLHTHLQTVAPLPLPTRGRGSRQSKHFPHPPSVALQHDESGTFFLLSLTATDRRGLLYAIAYVLARFRVSLHTAKIMTLGERVEDSFLLDARHLASEKTRVQLETELLEALS
jgi:[protein-PII] uridylyltransferase